MKLAVVNLKGGVGKTTSSIYLATELSKRGRTLLVDADPQGSALSWSAQASSRNEDLSFDVVSLPVKDLHKRLKTLGQGFEHIVIDSPPGHIDIAQSALLAAEVALIPLSPSLMEIERMTPALELIARVEELNPVKVHMLFNRVRRGTNSYKAAREFFSQMGLPVLDTEVPLREAYNAAFGTRPKVSPEYEDVLRELLGEPRLHLPVADDMAEPQQEAAQPEPQTGATEVETQAPDPITSPEVSESAHDAEVDEAITAPETVLESAVEAPVPAAARPTVREPIPATPEETLLPRAHDAAEEIVSPHIDPLFGPDAPRRRQVEGDEELAAFVSKPDPLAEVFSESDESPRPPYLRG